MEPSTPPILPPPVQHRKRAIGVVAAALIVVIILLVASFFLIPVMFGTALLAWMTKDGKPSVKFYDDQFSVTVLELKSEPNYFMEKVRVRCEKDMKVGIGVNNLKETGFFEVTGTNGEQFYREGHPQKAGQTFSIEAKDGFSTCDVLFKISTTSNNTDWHSEIAGGTCDTTLQAPLTISDVRTNWPGLYHRGSVIPLANLGDYKILLSIK